MLAELTTIAKQLMVMSNRVRLQAFIARDQDELRIGTESRSWTCTGKSTEASEEFLVSEETVMLREM